MEINTLEIGGFYSALKALRLPFGHKNRSITVFEISLVSHDDDQYDYTSPSKIHIYEKDFHLMQSLVKKGDEHAKVIRGIVVHAEIVAPVYFWCELETYRAGHERLSSESTMHIDCKGLVGEELVKAKSEIPMGKELMKIDMFSYQCLRNIYFQRRDHRLPEWKQFCKWIESLPMAKELITIEKQNHE